MAIISSFDPKGTTINDQEGAEEIEKKKFEALLQEKNLEGLPPGRKIGKGFYRKKKAWGGYCEEKINSFPIFPPPPPRPLMVDP